MIEKIKNQKEISAIVEDLRKQGKKVVWTNGCFDILHIGHIKYLQQAKGMGDFLIIGLNSDRSVKEIKGPARPIIPEEQRAQVLAALPFVDCVVVFDEPSPVKFLELLKPDVFAKGGDYAIETLNRAERNAVESYGGKIALIEPIKGVSTSAIIEKIVQLYGNK